VYQERNLKRNLNQPSYVPIIPVNFENSMTSTKFQRDYNLYGQSCNTPVDLPFYFDGELVDLNADKPDNKPKYVAVCKEGATLRLAFGIDLR
jgi:hypothetical protein